MMSTADLSRFLIWFEEDNMFPIKYASDEKIISAIQQYSGGDTDLEFDLSEEMFGSSAYYED
jgi:hypothetical protein